MILLVQDAGDQFGWKYPMSVLHECLFSYISIPSIPSPIY